MTVMNNNHSMTEFQKQEDYHRPTIVSISTNPTTTEEAYALQSSPVRVQVAPPSRRRRAQTLDVEWGGSTGYDYDDEDELSDYESCGSLGDDLESLSGNDTYNHVYDGGGDNDDAETPRGRGRHHYSDVYDEDDDEEEDDEMVLRQCRQSLLKSRCVRGFLALCVYCALVLQPHSSNTAPNTTYFIETFDQPPPQILRSSDFPSFSTTTRRRTTSNTREDVDGSITATTNSTSVASSSATAMRRAAAAKTTVPLAQLPHFHHRPAPPRRVVPTTRGKTTTTTSSHSTTPSPQLATAAVMINGTAAAAATQHPNHRPNDGTIIKVPPVPPMMQLQQPPSLGYHKKPRPILSYAHSYQLHQEPLVFGREQPTSFYFSSDSTDPNQNNHNGQHHHDHHHGRTKKKRSEWTNTLIWLSFIVLVVDTSYREYSHYRWYRQYVAASSPVSREEHLRRRTSHRRRSPSPEPITMTAPAATTTTTAATSSRELMSGRRLRFDSY